ncbi:hypothetical protein DW137_02690 [Bifidobacterium bifidum]|uniref:Uncharacterized protein n=1 Tax=Bifidobacterium bifidum TaxID=1681 RepID=A0A415C8J3_BIFBI|nr:hypothetical protein DW137_02690 [Bifidobacterium bifidum]
MRLSIESIAAPIARCSFKDGTKVNSSRKSAVTSSCIMVDAFVERVKTSFISFSLLMACFQ